MSRLTAYVVALLLTWSRLASAQALDSDYVERGPRFLLASTSAPVPVRVDVTRTPVLRQSISLDLNGVALGDALREISAKAGMQLAFSNTMLPAERTVTFRADHITVAAALTELLIDAQVDVLFSRDGRAVLVRRAEPFQGGTVTGRVTDAKSGRTIPNVLVLLEGTRWRATTGEDGAYRLADVAAGTYTLTASRIGYAKQSQSVTVTAGQEVTVNFALGAAATELEQVVVTGTVVPTERKAIPTPITVVSAEDIQRQNLQRVDQVFRGEVPGAAAWDQGPGQDFYSTINVRGASSLANLPSIKTFVDGVEVADPVYIALIDPASVDRIEVTRGPEASTMYGSGALSGVMQIFTKKGRLGLTGPEVTGKVSGGSIGGWEGTGTAFQTDNTVSVLGGDAQTGYDLRGSYRHVGEWAPSYRSTDWGFSAGSQTAQGPFTLSGSVRYSGKTFDAPFDPRFEPFGAYYSKPAYDTYNVRQQTYGVTTSWRATQNWQHTLTLGYDQTYVAYEQTQPRFTTPADSFLSASAFHRAKTSLFYHTDLSLRLGTAITAIVTAGANYDGFDYINSYTSGARRTTGTLDGSTSLSRTPWTTAGYFGQVQVDLADRLFLTAGLRAERSPTFGADFGTAWSPRVGAAYVLGLGGATVKLRGSYGESIRAPDPGFRDAFQSASSNQLANLGLAPERQRGGDGGVELYFGRRASLGVTYYNQRAINLIASVLVDASTTPATYQYQNIARIKNTGWEFEGRLYMGPVRLTGTYSITNSTVAELYPGYPTGQYQLGDPILGIPHTSAGAIVSYSPVPRTTVTANVTYIGAATNYDIFALFGTFFSGQPYRGSLRAYWMAYPTVTKFAVGVSQEVKSGLSAFVRVENVGNTLRSELVNSNIPTPRSVLVGAVFHY